MPGLNPGIHAATSKQDEAPMEWIAGSSPAMTRSATTLLSKLLPRAMLGYHRAAERLLESLAQLVLRLDGEVEAAVLLGEAFRFDEALHAHPGVALHAQADDMDGERCGFAAELLAEIARRAAARLFAVGQEHDQGGLGAIIEHLGGFRHRRGQRGFAGRRESLDRRHDALRRIRLRLEIETNVALIPHAGPVGDEPDAAMPCDAREYLCERGEHLVDAAHRARRFAAIAPAIARHRA